MKKSLLIALLLSFSIAGGYYYYFNYVEEITERYLVKYTIPHEEDGLYGTTMSDPKIDISRLKDYESDSLAIVHQKKEAESNKKWLLKQFSNEKFDDDDELMNLAKRNAYVNLLNEERMLISITHVRNMDAKEALDILKKHGLFSKDIKEYAEKKKLKANIYPL